MSRLLKITDNGNGILVQGTDNILYPQNDTLSFPYNSIIVVTDESDIATFRSAANNDVLFSGLIGYIEVGEDTVTKANIIEKFDAIANQASGGGGDMSDYYTKTQSDAKYATKTELDTKEEVISTALNDLDTNKQDTLTAGTNITIEHNVISATGGGGTQVQADWTESDTTDPSYIQHKPTLATVATSGDYNDLSNKPTIPAAQVNSDWNASSGVAQILNKPDLTVYATKADMDVKEEVISTALNELQEGKQDVLTAGANITIQNNVISATGGGTAQVQSDWNQSDSTAVDYIKNKPTIPDTSDFVSKTEYNPKEIAIANALVDLNTNKANVTDIPTVPTTVSSFTNDADYVVGTGITNIVSITQSDYEALITTDAHTLYVITSSSNS